MVFCEKSLFAPRPMAAGTSSPTFSKFSNFLALLVTAFYYSFATVLLLFTKFYYFLRGGRFFQLRTRSLPHNPTDHDHDHDRSTATANTRQPQPQIHFVTSTFTKCGAARNQNNKHFLLRYMFTTFYYVFDKVQENSRKFIEPFQSVQIAIPGIKVTSRENNRENIEK